MLKSFELLIHITVVAKESVNKIYHTSCVSGSLLLKFVKILGVKIAKIINEIEG